jgi:membrane protein implicated in regulation of membrane protease activity
VIEFLNHWWNVPFLVMLGLVAVFAVMQLIGIVGHHDHDVDHDLDRGGGQLVDQLLSFFGIGRVPFLVLWTTLCLIGGLTGIVVNFALWDASHRLPGWGFPLALVLALVLGVAAVRFAARLFAQVIDMNAKGATSKRDLVGKAGAVVSSLLDARHGEVRVHDGETEIMVHGRVQAGETALAHGARVVLVDYDEATDLYWVTASPDADAN